MSNNKENEKVVIKSDSVAKEKVKKKNKKDEEKDGPLELLKSILIALAIAIL